jgi:hypothetical protein
MQASCVRSTGPLGVLELPTSLLLFLCVDLSAFAFYLPPVGILMRFLRLQMSAFLWISSQLNAGEIFLAGEFFLGLYKNDPFYDLVRICKRLEFIPIVREIIQRVVCYNSPGIVNNVDVFIKVEAFYKTRNFYKKRQFHKRFILSFSAQKWLSVGKCI